MASTGCKKALGHCQRWQALLSCVYPLAFGQMRKRDPRDFGGRPLALYHPLGLRRICDKRVAGLDDIRSRTYRFRFLTLSHGKSELQRSTDRIRIVIRTNAAFISNVGPATVQMALFSFVASSRSLSAYRRKRLTDGWRRWAVGITQPTARCPFSGDRPESKIRL